MWPGGLQRLRIYPGECSAGAASQLRPGLCSCFFPIQFCLPGNFSVDIIAGMKAHQQFDIDYFQDEEGFFTARVPAIPGCIASGKTLKETYKNTVDAIESCLEARRKVGAMKPRKSRYAGVNTYKHTAHA